MFERATPLHFTGIGGIGMSGLALLCQAAGHPVSGSDVRSTELTARLASMGMRIARGHAAENVPPEAGALIYTSAVDASNPEVAEANRRGLPIVHRGALLAELMAGRRSVAVGGSHGKTTTTSMAATIAIRAGLDPAVYVGTTAAWLDGLNARAGKGDVMIAECDESDGSFLLLRPAIAVITNIDREHLDHYGGFEGVRAAFGEFAARAARDGCLIACCDDAEVRSVISGVGGRVVTYGRSEDASYRIESETLGPAWSEFSLRWGPVETIHRFRINAPGAHNVLNAAAAIAVAIELGVSPDAAAEALASYAGAGRRMELKGTAQGITVIDDYGHHPTEVRATISALRLRQPARLYVMFQPHRYTRTRDLLDEFSTAFQAADCVRVLEIYAASEPAIAGVSGADLAARIRAGGHPDCLYVGSLDGAVASSLLELQPGDLVLTLGAGSITEAGPRILKGLQKEHP